MLRDFYRHLEERIAAMATPAGGAAQREQDDRLAAVALLVEVMRADYQEQPAERRAVLAAATSAFDLAPAQAEELVREAEERAESATSLYDFTHLLNAHYDAAQKERLIESLWQVACADGRLDKYEEHLIRKVADLLYVPHMHFIRAKLRVLAASGMRDAQRGAAPEAG